MKVDVCIVGAGIAGLTTAYTLLLEGKSVAVLDDEPMGAGETQHATIHLTNALDTRYCDLERWHGEEGSRLAARSHTVAISCLEAIVANEGIDCDFERVDACLFVPPGESSDILERELAAAHRAGLTGVERLSRAPVDSFDTGPCLRFPQQAQFHPLKYLSGLAQIIQRHGGRIFSKTQVAKVEGGSLAWVETKAGSLVMADAVVVAMNTLVSNRVPAPAELAPCLTHVIGAEVPRGSVPRLLYQDTANPCHYARVHSLPLSKWSEEAYDILIVGGEDYQAGQADDAETRWARLEGWARQCFPMISDIKYGWSGHVMKPIDGLALIGRDPMGKPNVYIAAGDSGQGMTHGTIAGLLLADLMCGRENEWAGLYDPRRITLPSQETSLTIKSTAISRNQKIRAASAASGEKRKTSPPAN